MSKKTMGGVCAVICMVSVLVYFIWGTLAHSYENCWLVFMAAGIGCACVSIIGGIKKEKAFSQ